MQKLRWLEVLVGVALMSTQVCLGENFRRDGNWWRTLHQSTKIPYVLGFMDGMTFG
jgi:hypothetical protein